MPGLHCPSGSGQCTAHRLQEAGSFKSIGLFKGFACAYFQIPPIIWIICGQPRDFEAPHTVAGEGRKKREPGQGFSWI